MSNKPECEVVIQNPSRDREAGARRHRSWLEALVAALAPAAESLTVRLTGNREMRRLNGEFRGLDKVTDVLSFPDRDASHLECPAKDRNGHLGDIVICVPVAHRQAEELGHKLHHELRVLMLHGLLHCLGYDHETDDGTMEHLEGRLRKQWLSGATS